MGGRAGGFQGNWPRARESRFEREFGFQDLFSAGKRHGGELLAATRAGGKVNLVSGGFICAEGLVEISSQELGVRAIVAD